MVAFCLFFGYDPTQSTAPSPLPCTHTHTSFHLSIQRPPPTTTTPNPHPTTQLRCQELDELRASRKRIGCSCHQSKPPDKLSLKRLKEELHRRHLSAPGNDKGKLAELLKQALADERLCSAQAADACECFQAGVPCHADVCGCCAHKKGGAGAAGGAGGATGRPHLGCHNPVGNFVYKEGAVQGYRGRFVSARGVLDGRPRSCSI
jgi:hypothetical protein